MGRDRTRAECVDLTEFSVLKGKVLVIDDNTALLELTGDLLRAAGFTVVTTSNVVCANLISRERPDVVLMDVDMPGQRGDTAGRIFTEVPGLLNGGVILLHSARSSEELAVMALRAGVAGYISKSEGPVALVRHVESWVLRVRSRAQPASG